MTFAYLNKLFVEQIVYYNNLFQPKYGYYNNSSFAFAPLGFAALLEKNFLVVTGVLSTIVPSCLGGGRGGKKYERF